MKELSVFKQEIKSMTVFGIKPEEVRGCTTQLCEGLLSIIGIDIILFFDVGLSEGL